MSMLKAWYDQAILDTAGTDKKVVIIVKLTRQEFFCIVPSCFCSCQMQATSNSVTPQYFIPLGYHLMLQACHAISLEREASYTFRMAMPDKRPELIFMSPERFAKMLA